MDPWRDPNSWQGWWTNPPDDREAWSLDSPNEAKWPDWLVNSTKDLVTRSFQSPTSRLADARNSRFAGAFRDLEYDYFPDPIAPESAYRNSRIRRYAINPYILTALAQRLGLEGDSSYLDAALPTRKLYERPVITKPAPAPDPWAKTQIPEGAIPVAGAMGADFGDGHPYRNFAPPPNSGPMPYGLSVDDWFSGAEPELEIPAGRRTIGGAHSASPAIPLPAERYFSAPPQTYNSLLKPVSQSPVLALLARMLGRGR